MTYVLHPGSVISRHDGDRHYVGALQLARLYQLPTGSWRASEDDDDPYLPGEVHLFPRFDGNYTPPDGL